MQLYFCLPIYHPYKDRYKMFMTMCNYGVDVKAVLIHGKHPQLDDMPDNFEQLSIPENTTPITRKRYIKELLSNIDKNDHVVIQDTFVSQLGLYKHRRLSLGNKNVRNVLSLYFTNPEFTCKMQWRGKNPKYMVPLKEYPFYLTKYAYTTINEYISCSLSDMITGNSEEIIEGVQKYYRIGKHRTKFISAEIDCDFYCPDQECRGKLKLPNDKKIILYAGKIQRHKGFDTVVEAFEKLWIKDNNTMLLILGDTGYNGVPWYKKMLEGKKSLNNIEFRKPVGPDVLKDYYRSSDVFILPTYHEGSPRAVKEALACGCPVISSKTSGNYAIDPDEKALILADDWTPELYFELLNKVLTNSSYRSERIQSGLKVVQELEIEKVSQRYFELYKSLF